MLAISLFLLYFAFKGVKWEDFVSGIKGCNFWWIGLSMVASILAFYFRALRWRLVMLPLNNTITRREAYDGVTVAYLTNFALPRAGELARCGVVAATKKASFESVLGSVVLERSFDMLTYIVILFSVIVFRWTQFGGFFSEQVWKPIAGSLQFNIIWLILGIIAIVTITIVLLYKYRETLKRRKFFQKLFKIFKGLCDGLVSGFKMKYKWNFFIYTILLWGCYWLMSLFTIYAFPEVGNLNGVDALFLMVVGGLGWIVPVQGGIGAYHFILSLALASLYGIPQTNGVIFATISHESQAVTMIVCGTISLISIYLSKKVVSKRQN